MGVVDDLELLDESEASPSLGEVELRPSGGAGVLCPRCGHRERVTNLKIASTRLTCFSGMEGLAAFDVHYGGYDLGLPSAGVRTRDAGTNNPLVLG
jgi:hypothetical protein